MFEIEINFTQYNDRFEEEVVKNFTYKSIKGVQNALERLANKLYGKDTWEYVYNTTLVGGYVRTFDDAYCLEAIPVH